jgi:GNAT superfamily N-acetyltransferase
VDDHPLAAVLIEAAHGRFPAYDGAVEVLPALNGLAGAIFSFTGHSIITTDLDEDEVRRHLPGGSSLGTPLHPAFVAWLAKRLNAHSYTPDLVLVAFKAKPDPAFELVERPGLITHPRAVLAQAYRKDVHCYSNAAGDGLLTLGLGICGRYEVSVEVEPALRNRGLGRRLAYAARSLVPEDEPVFAEVSPGNAASLRAFLAAGYVPIGSEVGMLSQSVD